MQDQATQEVATLWVLIVNQGSMDRQFLIYARGEYEAETRALDIERKHSLIRRQLLSFPGGYTIGHTSFPGTVPIKPPDPQDLVI